MPTGADSNLDAVRATERRGANQAIPDNNTTAPGGLTDAQIPASIARDSEVTSAIAALSSVYVPQGGTLASVSVSPPADGVIAALTSSATTLQAEFNALRDQCEILRDAVASCKAVIETLRVHA